jgi:7-cyano-7-deazaguanine synthase
MSEKAIVLLSGGLDSATVLAIASQQFDCIAISFDYHQRHVSELNAARQLAEKYAIRHQLIRLDDGVLAGSALTDDTIDVPQHECEGIPVTYVPARNTVFLAHALAVAEVAAANDIFIGVNAVDYSGYPDCRAEYIDAFSRMANLATQVAVEGQALHIRTPLIELSKAEIIQQGLALGVDYAQTVSCYQADDAGRACGRCDSCRFRKQGFAQAGVADPTRYI